MMDLVRGQKIKIADITTENRLNVELSCEMPTDIALHILCFGLDAQNALHTDGFIISSARSKSHCGSIECLSRNDDGCQQFQVDLEALPQDIKKLAFVFLIDGEGVMSQIKKGHLKFFDQSNELAYFPFSGSDFDQEKALIVSEIYFKNVWRLAAVGQGFNAGLSELLGHIGKDQNTTISEMIGDSSESGSMSSDDLDRASDAAFNTQMEIEKNEPMHEENIEILKKEAERLIDLQLAVLNKMLEEQGVLSESQDNQSQTFDLKSTPQHIEILEGEKKKLERLEMVLAVVGTMKAGKSTAINAIVGTEVLPNRNRPMTALPTLIEHTPGQLEPVLEFDNSAPIEKLLKELGQAMRQHGAGWKEKYAHDSDMLDLLARIERQDKFKQIYEGAEAIFDFLKRLNDLVRLSMELDVEFPFANYSQIHELPVIKIEFVHLREFGKTTGKLTLLDTPGPNESGQTHLRKMLKEQLDRASGVLAVLDFTQLKSDADAQVREHLLEIASVAEGRLYVLVNKFDQKDRNSDSAEKTKALVANDLMRGNISPDLVFPVSSKLGYLANRAKRELLLYKKLPNHQEQSWVSDFGKEAFGPRWENQISNPQRVRENAEYLWEESRFHAPLKQVIQAAHAQAALFAIDSAAAKLNDLSEKLGNFLNTRETALSKSTQELKDQIGALQRDVDRVSTIENDAKKRSEEMLTKLEQETKSVFGMMGEAVRQNIDGYFKEGKRLEKEEHERQLKQKKNSIKITLPVFLVFGSQIRILVGDTM